MGSPPSFKRTKPPFTTIYKKIITSWVLIFFPCMFCLLEKQGNRETRMQSSDSNSLLQANARKRYLILKYWKQNVNVTSSYCRILLVILTSKKLLNSLIENMIIEWNYILIPIFSKQNVEKLVLHQLFNK